MNFDEIDKLLESIMSKESESLPDGQLFSEQKLNMCNTILLAVAKHKVNSYDIAKVASMIPDLEAYDADSISDSGYDSLMRSIGILVKVYKRNKKQVEDIIFLLQWYQRECRRKYGKAS